MPDQGTPSAPRIAISFGKPPASKSKSNGNAAQQRPRHNPPSHLGKRTRPHGLGGNDSDSESGDDHGRHGRHETITEVGGSKAEPRKPRELVIEKQANRDWKSELRMKRGGGGGKNLLPAEVQASRTGRVDNKDTEPADEDKEIQWGLSIKKRKTSPGEDGSRSPEQRDGDERNTQDAKPAEKPQTADEEAMDALLGKKKKKPTQEHVIRASEDDAYKEDVTRHVGADSTLEDYEAIPEDEFGAALLRGMGWDGKMRGPKPRAAAGGERRQNQLGLGAKKLKDAEELGQWNQGGKRKDARPPRVDEYRRQEEKRKAERRERRGEGYREERDRERDRYGDHDRHRHRDRERDRDRDSYRNGDSRRR